MTDMPIFDSDTGVIGRFRSGPSQRSKVLLICDNRDELNWGCRATSIALHGILSEHFEVDGRVGRRDVLRKESRHPAIARLSARGGNPIVRAAIGALVQRSDYISGDIEKSAENILANRHASPFFRALLDRFEAADRVVVNGEGSMVFKPTERRDVRFQLTMLELARKLGKPGYYVNAMISDFPGAPRNEGTWETCRKHLSRCAGVQVRDHHSYALLEEMKLETRIAVAPDALFSAADSGQFPRVHPGKVPAALLAPFPEEPTRLSWTFDAPYVCVGGSSYFRSQGRTGEGRAFYTDLATRIRKSGYRCIFVATCTGDRFLEPIAEECGCDFIPVETGIFAASAILANAAAFVSGRYHPSILASVGGTPCVFLESNSHKMASLRLWLGEEGEEISYRAEDALRTIEVQLADIFARGAGLRRNIRLKARTLSRMARQIPTVVDSSVGRRTSIPAAA